MRAERADRNHRDAPGPGRGKSGFYHGVDEMQALVEARERALHRVNCQPFDVRPAIAEFRRQPVELRAQRDLAHQPVVGVHRHPERQLPEHPERVQGDKRDRQRQEGQKKSDEFHAMDQSVRPRMAAGVSSKWAGAGVSPSIARVSADVTAQPGGTGFIGRAARTGLPGQASRARGVGGSSRVERAGNAEGFQGRGEAQGLANSARMSPVVLTRPMRGKILVTVSACSSAERADMASSAKTWLYPYS